MYHVLTKASKERPSLAHRLVNILIAAGIIFAALELILITALALQ